MFRSITIICLSVTILNVLVSAEHQTYNEKIIKLGNLNGHLENLNTAAYSKTLETEEESKEVNLVASFAEAVLQNDQGLLAVVQNQSVSDRCIHDFESIGMAVAQKPRQLWAVQMIDAAGKPPSGLLDGSFTWLGSYDECVNVVPVVFQGPNMTEPTKPFKGQYCLATMPLQTQAVEAMFSGAAFSVGLCVPSTCQEEELVYLINSLLEVIPGNATKGLRIHSAKCQKEELEYDTRAIIVLVICGLFISMIILGTMYDVFVVHKLHLDDEGSPQKLKASTSILSNGTAHESHVTIVDHERDPLLPKSCSKGSVQVIDEPGTLGKIIVAFSVYTNGSKLLSTNQGAGTLRAVNGIRLFSMTWVILGHTYGSVLQSADNVGPFYVSMLKRWSFQAIVNATVSVDSFFTLSGLLLTYLSLKEMKKIGGAGKFKWGLFYFHRFWRLTPPYMLVMMVYVPLYQYWNNGPTWSQKGIELDYCSNTWWRNLLYINNFFGFEKMCMAWSWYLSNDMQFYVISPLLLIPLYYSSLFGGLVCLAFFLATTITPGVMSSINKWPSNFLGGGAPDAMISYMDDYYIKPYCRMGPYIVGMVTGYILYRTDCKFRMSKLVNLAGWAVAAACCLSVIYGPYNSLNGSPNSNDVNALYNAVHRSVWAVGVSWVIFACATGHGGIVNGFLSWKALIPLARLTYCAYLVHPVIQSVYEQSKRDFSSITDLELIYVYLGHLAVAYGVAFVVSLAFESPFMGLEKAIFKRERKS